MHSWQWGLCIVEYHEIHTRFMRRGESEEKYKMRGRAQQHNTDNTD